MKSRLILLFALFGILSAFMVSGAIIFNNNFRTYNIGDSESVQGYIESNNDVRNVFRLYLECGDSVRLLAGRTISISANNKYFFDEKINLLGGNNGECSFKATFMEETQLSQKFQISDALKGDIFVNKKSFKLGETLKIDGDVLYLNNNKVDGVGIFSIIRNDLSESYFVDTSAIEDGNVLFTAILENLPPTKYNIILEAYDSYGNNKKFDLGIIDITDKLSVNAYLDKKDYLPGETFNVNLKVNENPRDFIAKINFEDEATDQMFEGTDFSYLIKIKDNIKSGQHAVSVKITDDYGNYYEGNLDLNVIPVPKRLDVGLDKADGYLPEEKAEIFSAVYDQADDLYQEGSISIKIIDTKKNEKTNVNINSGDTYNLDLEKYILPGIYTVIAEGSNFRKETTFNVKELEKINVYYEGNRLKILNEGNTKINDGFLVYLDDRAITNFNLNAKPAEIKEYDLRSFIKENKVYNLRINFKDHDIDVGEALITDDRSISNRITGSVVGMGKDDFIVYILLLLIVALLVLFLFYRPKKIMIEKERRDGYKEGQQKLRKIMDEKISKAGKKGKEMNKDEVRDFRESIMKRIKE